jgi:hypothetical protein
VERFVSTCGPCQRSKAYTAPARGIPTPLEAPNGRWQAVALDLVSLAESAEGYDAVVVFTDMFTKQIFCAPVRMKGTTAEKVADSSPFMSSVRRVCPRSYFQIATPFSRPIACPGAPRPGATGARVPAGGGGAVVVRAFVFARRASKVLPKVCRSIYHQGVTWNQYGGVANSPANPVRPHRYGCQCRSSAVLQAVITSTWFI